MEISYKTYIQSKICALEICLLFDKCVLYLKGLQINLYLEQPMEIQLFATFFQRRK
jgi:hypothetical protein